VVGVPEDVLGEKVVAVIALRQGSLPHDGTEGHAADDTALETKPGANKVAKNSNKEDTSEHKETTTAEADLLKLVSDNKGLQQALRAFLHDKLAIYKQPREYIVVDAIPRNHLGKVQYTVVLAVTCVLLRFSASCIISPMLHVLQVNKKSLLLTLNTPDK
jgi:acyl-coenzyme A synthetase/AMP-(fatty) acid ligase